MDTLIKEQEKLVMQIKAMMKEKERLLNDNDQCRNDSEKDEGKVRTLEYQVSKMQGHMDVMNDMVDNLKNAMPS
jgi:predicted nuclease with TOPRIM domain